VVLSIAPVDGKSALFGRNSFFNVLDVFFNLANLRIHVTHQIVVGHPEIICKNTVFRKQDMQALAGVSNRGCWFRVASCWMLLL